MPGIFDVLSIAKSALEVQQYGIQVAGHNIANANTEGYSRQRVVSSARTPLDTPHGPLGTGVQVEAVERERDRFLDEQVRTAGGELGRWTQAERALSEVEGVFSEPSEGGLNALLRKFWDGWRALADRPESMAARQVVLGRARALVEAFHRLRRKLEDVQYDMNTSISSKVEEVNRIAGQIADLNLKILNSEVTGHAANDERDRRDLLLDRLAEIVKIKVIEGPDGTVNVYVSGRPLVEGKEVSRLSTVSREGLPVEVVWEDDYAEVDVSGGELKGILEARGKVGSYMERLDIFARTLAGQVNSIHMEGYTLDGATGINFFRSDVQGADDIELSDEVSGDPSKIAASKDGGPGDGSNALDIADLEYQRPLDDYYRSIVVELGQDLEEARFMRENHELLSERLRNERESVIGVSLDEEMIKLIRYQHAYVAAAKLTSIVDEMIGTALEMMR